MTKSETQSVTLTLIPSEKRVQQTPRGGEIEKIPVLEGTKVLVNGQVYRLSIYNGEITVDRWLKSPAPKTEGKAPKKDI